MRRVPRCSAPASRISRTAQEEFYYYLAHGIFIESPRVSRHVLCLSGRGAGARADARTVGRIDESEVLGLVVARLLQRQAQTGLRPRRVRAQRRDAAAFAEQLPEYIS